MKTELRNVSLTITLLSLLPLAGASQPAKDLEQALNSISAASLRGNLSFIASDLLEGRDTPSGGLDIAAEYIAAQFRKAGLEEVGDDGYYQTATVPSDDPATARFSCTISGKGEPLYIQPSQISVIAANKNIDITDVPIVSLPFPLDEGDGDLAHEDPCIVITDMPSYEAIPRSEMREYFQQFSAFMRCAGELRATAVLTLDEKNDSGTGPGAVGRLSRMAAIPVFMIHDRGIMNALHEGQAGLRPARLDHAVSLKYELPAKIDIAVRNVVGLLRGSDPELQSQYIIVTGHYDHIGRSAPIDGDAIYNGANDDGSGTVSVIEIASALARLGKRPRRSILFMCLYGEERGLLGSRHYVEHPIFPLRDTIANVNLEHFGRTDDSEGPSVKRIMPTGFNYSTMIQPFLRAGEAEGVELYHHPQNSASFFGRSDNVAFASAGIPAHTFCTSFIFPDYHGVPHHWDRIDYENMAHACRVVARGLVALANDDEVPSWNEEVRGTRRYVEAWKRLHND